MQRSSKIATKRLSDYFYSHTLRLSDYILAIFKRAIAHTFHLDSECFLARNLIKIIDICLDSSKSRISSVIREASVGGGLYAANLAILDPRRRYVSPF